MSEPSLYRSSAFLLVYHGSRDPRPKTVCHQLARYFQQKLNIFLANYHSSYASIKNQTYPYNLAQVLDTQPELSPVVETVALELAELPLHQNILRFAQKALTMGHQNLVIVPLFLSLGVHVTQDIPSEIALAQSQLQQDMEIVLSPPLGSYSGLKTLISNQFAQLSASARILLAHGSRLNQANSQTEALADECNAQIAYWSTEPYLETVIAQKMVNKPKKLAIMPYFLFPGRINDAIAEKVVELQPTFPETHLILGQPLGGTEALAQLILENIIA